MRVAGDKQGVEVASVHGRGIVVHPHHRLLTGVGRGEQHTQGKHGIAGQDAVDVHLDETAAVHHLLALAVIPNGCADVEILANNLPGHMVHHIQIDKHRQGETRVMGIGILPIEVCYRQFR